MATKQGAAKKTAIKTMTMDEIQKRIPYALICETRYGAHWDTMKRRRKWKELTDEAARRRFARLFKLANDWTLVHGVPETYRMRKSELSDWDFLASFCCNLAGITTKWWP